MIGSIPNILTSLRIVLAFFLVFFYDRPSVLLPLFLLGGITDFLDGTVARRFHCQSVSGSWLDPLADKILIHTALAILVSYHNLPLSFFLANLSRDTLICGGACTLYFFGKKTLQPSWMGKGNTVLQIFLCALGFLILIHPFKLCVTFFSYLLTALWVTTLWSGTAYMMQGISALNRGAS